jgi:pyridinium-3,5-bisthiocarboxylic acid mononucleotide nickel chelatase
VSDVTVAWFHCFAGIAGDMALGSLLDAGADLDEVRALVERLPVAGWSLSAEPVLRCGIASTHVKVALEHSIVVRTAAHIGGLIEEARLPPRVRDRALATFRLLAEVEGRIHRRPVSAVHFHEVGALDSIVDVVGTCAALEVLDVSEIRASEVAQGSGMVRTAHGMLPNPVPAVVELLRDAPTFGLAVPFELTTPTGAALLAALGSGWGPLPAMTVRSVGYGAGGRELDGLPNVTQVVIGTKRSTPASVGGESPGQPVVLLEANVDDATGEVLAAAIAALMEAGAHDAWVTPIVMKKGRPAHTVSCLCDPALAPQCAGVLGAETGSLGIRGQRLERWPVTRAEVSVLIEDQPVRVKVSPGRVKAEHDDAARAAARTGLPLREVLRRAEAAAAAPRVAPHLVPPPVPPDAG